MARRCLRRRSHEVLSAYRRSKRRADGCRQNRHRALAGCRIGSGPPHRADGQLGPDVESRLPGDHGEVHGGTWQQREEGIVALYTTIHLHNVPAGRESEYATWFDGPHRSAVSALRGFKSAERYEVTREQIMPD